MLLDHLEGALLWHKPEKMRQGRGCRLYLQTRPGVWFKMKNEQTWKVSWSSIISPAKLKNKAVQINACSLVLLAQIS